MEVPILTMNNYIAWIEALYCYELLSADQYKQLVSDIESHKSDAHPLEWLGSRSMVCSKNGQIIHDEFLLNWLSSIFKMPVAVIDPLQLDLK